MLTPEDLAQLTPDERARYDRASDLDKRFVEQYLRENIARRATDEAAASRAAQKVSPSDPLQQSSMNSHASRYVQGTKYGVARFVIAVEDFIGFLLLVLGGGWFLVSLSSAVGAIQQMSERGRSVSLETILGMLSFGSLLPSLGMVLIAVFMFAHSQMLRATLDTADDMRELLSVTKASFAKKTGT